MQNALTCYTTSQAPRLHNLKKKQFTTVLEITVGHRTLSDQILKMSSQFHIMIGHDDRTSHQHILSYLLQGVVSQCFMSGPICQMSDQKEDLRGHMSCE